MAQLNVTYATAPALSVTFVRGVQGVQGIQGIQGIQGVQGIAGLLSRGNWSAATTYAANDWVFYPTTGSAYASLVGSNLNNAPPAAGTSNAYWTALSQVGSTGPQGIQGPAGTLTTVASFTGAHTAGEIVYHSGFNGIFVCTVSGTPGTWIETSQTSAFPSSPQDGLSVYRTDYRAFFQYDNATTSWKQMSVGDWAANPTSPTTNLRIWRTDLSAGYFYDGTVWRKQNPEVWGPSIEAKPTAAQVLLRQSGYVGTIRTTGHSAVAGTAATAQADSLLQKNGSTFGTIRFAASGTTATLVSFSATAFAASDVLTLLAPSSVDATLAKIAYRIVMDQQ